MSAGDGRAAGHCSDQQQPPHEFGVFERQVHGAQARVAVPHDRHGFGHSKPRRCLGAAAGHLLQVETGRRAEGKAPGGSNVTTVTPSSRRDLCGGAGGRRAGHEPVRDGRSSTVGLSPVAYTASTSAINVGTGARVTPSVQQSQRRLQKGRRST